MNQPSTPLRNEAVAIGKALQRRSQPVKAYAYGSLGTEARPYTVQRPNIRFSAAVKEKIDACHDMRYGNTRGIGYEQVTASVRVALKRAIQRIASKGYTAGYVRTDFLGEPLIFGVTMELRFVMGKPTFDVHVTDVLVIPSEIVSIVESRKGNQ